MGLTTQGQLPYPDGVDPIKDGDDKIKQLAEAIDALYAPWTPYTPTVSGMTMGASVATGAYWRMGKTVKFWARIVIGAGFSFTTAPAITIPVTAKGIHTWDSASAELLDTGTTYAPTLVHPTTSNIIVYAIGTTSAIASITNTFPFTWAVTDEIMVRGGYEAA